MNFKKLRCDIMNSIIEHQGAPHDVEIDCGDFYLYFGYNEVGIFHYNGLYHGYYIDNILDLYFSKFEIEFKSKEPNISVDNDLTQWLEERGLTVLDIEENFEIIMLELG